MLRLGAAGLFLTLVTLVTRATDPHGPDAATFENASTAELKPHKIEDTLAFMFEARLPIRPTRFALETPTLQRDYDSCWLGMPKLFKG